MICISSYVLWCALTALSVSFILVAFPVKCLSITLDGIRKLRYSSRLSLHSRVPFTRVFINFIRAIRRRSRVTDSSHTSHTSCAAATRKSYFVQCTRVIHRVLHASQTWRAARESDLVRYTRLIVCSYVYYVRITPN